MKKLIKNPWFLILVGALFLYLAFTGSKDKVMCNEVEMKPGDICGTLTYEQKERGNTFFTYGLMGLGAILIIVSVRKIGKKK